MVSEDYRLRYPIGNFVLGKIYNQQETQEQLENILSLPTLLKQRITQIGSQNLLKPYRLGGWNGFQVIHHIADSHMNALIRLKLALCETTPVIKPYPEDKFALLVDYLPEYLEESLMIITGVHSKLSHILKQLSEEDLERRFFHPGSSHLFTIRETIAMYSWHGMHHLAHLDLLKHRKS